MQSHPCKRQGAPRWQPEEGERYFAILANGTIKQIPWHDTPFDYAAWQFGNCFRTRTTAEQAWQVVHDVLHAVQQEQADQAIGTAHGDASGGSLMAEEAEGH